MARELFSTPTQIKKIGDFPRSDRENGAPPINEIESQPRRMVYTPQSFELLCLATKQTEVRTYHVFCLLHLGGSRTTFTDVRHAALPTIPVATAFTA